MSVLRLGVAGATGRMGRALVRLAQGAPDVLLTAAVTVPGDALLGADAGLVAMGERIKLPLTVEVPNSATCDVLIEFTSPAGCAHWAAWCAAHRVALVSGTTGLSAEQQTELHAAAEKIPIVWAPNMSVGANLLIKLVAQVAARLGAEWDIEIVETHHRRKPDAPSGTALALLQAAATARGADPARDAVYGRHGQVGPCRAGEIGVHAVSRDTFAAGALQAARWVAGRKPGLYAMNDVVG